jgi:hypothetical protein
VIVALVTTLADVFGKGPAGFLGGLPSSGAVNLLSIGLTQSTSAAVQATVIFPLGFASTFAFLLFYTVPKRIGFGARMLLSLGLWLPISAAVAVWGPDDFALSVGASLVVATAVLFVRRRVATTGAELPPSRPSARLTVLRGILGGSVVAAVVTLSVAGGPMVGGVFSAAPAIWSSSLFVTSRARGVEFSRSLTWSFMQAGILTVIPYGIAAHYFFANSGIWLGTLLSYAAISPLALVAWWLTNRRGNSRQPQGQAAANAKV